ncbi:hypothetical protein Tco_0508620 [Tanacetum coccineum]
MGATTLQSVGKNRNRGSEWKLILLEKRIDEDPLWPLPTNDLAHPLQEIEKIDKFASMDIITKAHYLRVMVEGNWITNPGLIQGAFLQFIKRKFPSSRGTGLCSLTFSFSFLNCMDRDTLERQMILIIIQIDAKDMDNIIRVLHVFYLASGTQINIHKS